MNETPDYPEDDEETVDFGEFRPIRIRGLKKDTKNTDHYEWDDE